MVADPFWSTDTKRYETPAGAMAYTDVGTGPPALFLHGNPTNAFLYRHLIRELSTDHRCVAPDYLGFGRSDKPTDFSYRPQAHATHVEGLCNQLGLDDLTLVMHDWGGPIGLSFALQHPDRVKRLVLFNTWGWPHDRDWWVRSFSLLAGSPLGRILIRRYNAFARWIVPLAVADRSRLSHEAVHAYADPLDTPDHRTASWILSRSLRTETEWLRSLWSHRERLRNHPTLVCWGTRDPAFGAEQYLRRWTSLFANATVHRLDVGHYVPEEMGTDLVPIVRGFLQSTPGTANGDATPQQ